MAQWKLLRYAGFRVQGFSDVGFWGFRLTVYGDLQVQGVGWNHHALMLNTPSHFLEMCLLHVFCVWVRKPHILEGQRL